MDDLILFPAIDLKDGQCVRLYKGEMNQSKIFNDNPAAQAMSFESEGFSWLHLVDLNGAFAGESVNKDAILDIRKSISLPIQLGGGIRTMQNIAYWIEHGINRLILGTVALNNPDLVKQACKEFAGHIAVGVDARDSMVAVQGWAEQSNISAVELSKKFEDAGVSAIIYTDINRDGALSGVNIEQTVHLAQSISTPVIASGGLSSYDDITALRQAQKHGIIGAISGKALYEKHIVADKALAICGQAV